jgi:hypothetical protein
VRIERQVVQRTPRPRPAVFDYLTDIRNRPEWQSSLRAVEVLTDHSAGVGARWRDLTWAGPRPVLEVVVHEPHRAWAEVGRWRGIEVFLALDLRDVRAAETEIEVTVRAGGQNLGWRQVSRLLCLLAPAGIRYDLSRVSRYIPG